MKKSIEVAKTQHMRCNIATCGIFAVMLEFFARAELAEVVTMAATKKNGGIETVRIQFTLPASLVEAIDDYCARAHMLRSTYVEYTLASSLNSQTEIQNELVGKLSDMVESTSDE